MAPTSRPPKRWAKLALLASWGLGATALAGEGQCVAGQGACEAAEPAHGGVSAQDHILLQMPHRKGSVLTSPRSRSQPVALTDADADQPECHTAVEGERCYRVVKWAMRYGFPQSPQKYTGLSAESSFADFQAWMHAQRDPQGCPLPCRLRGGAVAGGPAPARDMPEPPAAPPALDMPVELPAEQPPAPALQTSSGRYAAVDQPGARIPVGGEIRLYFIGTSNIAWQTWPDQLHALLQGLGYVLPAVNYTLADIRKPTQECPGCDNSFELDGLETPRLAKVGWSSWGFVYENKADCQGGPFGYRSILGHQISCVNSWACRLDGQESPEVSQRTLVRPSEIAADARDVDVVLLSNWMNDFKQRFSQFVCFNNENIDFFDMIPIALRDLRMLIQSIRSVNSKAVFLVMALYSDSVGAQVDESTMYRTIRINSLMKAGIEEPGVFFVNYTFPIRHDVFQLSHAGHPNCRGDKVMATRVVETLFENRIIGRGLALPPWEAPVGTPTGGTTRGAGCPADLGACASLPKHCCQRSALCRVAMDSTCIPFGPEGRR